MRRRARKMSRLGCIYFVVLLGALIGGSLWLDRRGDTARAVVTGKHEEIRVQQTPRDEWARWYRIGVEFPTPDGGLGMATVTVPQERYDALRRGDSLDVHYLPAFPLLARAADRSTAQVLWDIGHGLLGNRFLLAMLMWLGAGFVALWIAARVATALVFVVGLAWTALAVPLLFPAPTPAFPAPAAATARVEAITLVTKSPARRGARRHRAGRSLGDATRRLAQPYQVVILRLTAPGFADSVTAVDAVDSASAPGVRVGAILPIRLDPRAPRNARLADGTRTFRARNRYHFLVPVLGVGLLGVLGAWGWRTRRRSGRGDGAGELTRPGG